MMTSTSAILGASLGAGFALLAAMTFVVCRYYSNRKKGLTSSWGELERFESRPTPFPSRSVNFGYADDKGKLELKLKSKIHPRPSTLRALELKRMRERQGNTLCPFIYAYPSQEFQLDREERIVQPIIPSSFHRLSGLFEGAKEGENMNCQVHLTHQSRSLPVGPPIPGARLSRTSSISSQGQIESAVRKGHRGSSPAIRTFTPEGIALTYGVSPPDSPPLTYMGSRSPSPLNIRTSSLDAKSLTSNSSSLDVKGNSLGEGKVPSHSSSNLFTFGDNPLLPLSNLRRGSRCLSPLMISPKSPTLSDASSQSPGPISPLLGSLQLDLYQKKDVSLFLPMNKQAGFAPNDRATPLGRLHFRLKYDLDKSDLHVHIIEAHDLAGSEQGGFNDPYVRLFLSTEVDSRKRQTNIHRNEANPFFDETFKFPVSQDDLKEKILILQVFDYDRFSRNDVVGEVSMRLEDFNVTTHLEIWAEVFKNKNPSGERQEILVSLSYLPSAERLTVVLLKARNLYFPPNKDSLDPFVKVYMVGGGKRLKKKKTSARKGTTMPVWNEAVTFPLPTSMLANSALEICVLDQSNDLIGSTALIGSCILGPKETGVELSHWMDISTNYRKSVAMWHVLT